MLCLALAVCSDDWVPALLFTRPFWPLRRWSIDGEIEIVGPPSADELPQWSRHLFRAKAKEGHRYFDDVDQPEYSSSREHSVSCCAHYELRPSPEVEELSSEGIILLKSAEEGLFLAMVEARKEEVLDKLSPQQHVQLWVDLLQLTIYTYPDPYAEGFDFQVRNSCKKLITSTILPFLSVVDREHLQALTPNNLRRLVHFLLYRLVVEDQCSDPWIYLKSSILEELKLDRRLGRDSRHGIEILQWRESLARETVDQSNSRKLKSAARRWLATPRLRAMITAIMKSYSCSNGKQSIESHETVLHALQNTSYSFSTFERCADMLNASSETDNVLTKLRARDCDVYVCFAMATELTTPQRFAEARVLLHSVVGQLDDPPGRRQCLFLPAVIELVKCCNLLNTESEGEAIASRILAYDEESWDPADLSNLRIVLADSLIGQKKYTNAEEVIIDLAHNLRVSSYIRTIAKLRLNKIRRRKGTLKSLAYFENPGELSTNTLNTNFAAAIREEYCNELSATLSHSDVVQALLATSDDSVKAVQDLLLQSISLENYGPLAQIGVRWDDVLGENHISKIRQSLEYISQRKQHGQTTYPGGEDSPKMLHGEALPPPLDAQQASKQESEGPQDKEREIALDGDRLPRSPVKDDFPRDMQVDIFPSEMEVKHAVVLFHPPSDLAESIERWAREIGNRYPEATIIAMRGFNPMKTIDGIDHSSFELFVSMAEDYLASLINSVLISTCGFPPRDIYLLGYGQGGTITLTMAAICPDVELGGVVSIEGSAPLGALTALETLPSISAPLGSSSKKRISPNKIRTPALLIRGRSRVLDSLAIAKIESNFDTIETCISDTINRATPHDSKTKEALYDFLGHRLGREEWNRPAVLTFDSGGFRSYGSLLILQALMEKMRDEEQRLDALEKDKFTSNPRLTSSPYASADDDFHGLSSGTGREPTTSEQHDRSSLYSPCQYFDYITGTGSGGLLAIMLSRLRMSVEESLTEYAILCQKVFGFSRPFSSALAPLTRFNYKVLEIALHGTVSRMAQDLGDGEQSFRSDEDLCKTKVWVAAESEAKPFIFSSYGASLLKESVRNARHDIGGWAHPTQEVHTWQVAQASLTIPGYFPPINIKIGDVIVVDTGFLSGDIIKIDFEERTYRDICESDKDSPSRMGPFTSIGARKSQHRAPSLRQLADLMRLSAPQRGNKIMAALSVRDQFPYHAFDGGEQLHDKKFDQWEKRAFASEDNIPETTAINKAVESYLATPYVQRDLEECAKNLVKRRRLRARDASAWDRYAFASFYQCSYQGCPVPQERFKRVEHFKEHVMEIHSAALARKPLEQALKECRRCWTDPKPEPPVPHPYGREFPSRTKFEPELTR